MTKVRCPHCERQMTENIENTGRKIQTFQCSHCRTTVARMPNHDAAGKLYTDIVNKPELRSSAADN